VAITKRLAKFQAKVALLKAELSDSLESYGSDLGRRMVLAEDCED